ncbi:hypothetical protein K501DRAFT_214688, partial [Backusella circina FSU 941]
MMEDVQQRKPLFCFKFMIRSDRMASTLSGVLVIRALWQIWDAIDNNQPATMDATLLPIIYTSCILSICLVIMSVISTWSVYKSQIRCLNICWWLFYILTLFTFFNDCTNLTLLSLGREDFIMGCQREDEIMLDKQCSDDPDCMFEDLAPPYPCHNIWEESIIWAVVITILDLVVNIGFAHVLYQCRVRYQIGGTYSSSQIQPVSLPPCRNIQRAQKDDE